MTITLKNVRSIGTTSGVSWACLVCVDGMDAVTVEERGDGSMPRMSWLCTQDIKKRLLDYVDSLPAMKWNGFDFPATLDCICAEKIDAASNGRLNWQAAAIN